MSVTVGFEQRARHAGLSVDRGVPGAARGLRDIGVPGMLVKGAR